MFALQQSTALTVPVFAFDSSGVPVTGKVTGDWTKRISKASGAFAAMTVTVTEKEGGWYDLVMDTGHTNTLGILTVYLTATGVMQINLQWMVTLPGESGANVTYINGGLTTGNNATLSLASLNIVNSAGSAIVATSSGGNGHGMALTGNGTAAGLRATAGATGHGIQTSGGGTSGYGLYTLATAANYSGILASGGSAGSGIEAAGGAGGSGLSCSVASGNGHGILAVGQGTGAGLRASAGATGHGIQGVGGATSGSGLRATSQSGNSAGMNVVGIGTGAGLLAQGGVTNGAGVALNGIGSGAGLLTSGGATGAGLEATGGATSGDGIRATTSGGKALGDAAVDSILNRDMTTPTGVPAATATLASALGRIYMALRNKVIVNATEKIFHDDSGVATFKKPIADSGSVYTEDEGTTP